MPGRYLDKTESERIAEINHIIESKNKAAGERWIRESAIEIAEDYVLKELIPELLFRCPRQRNIILMVAKHTKILSEELKKAPFPDSKVPRIPFPYNPN